MFITYICIYHIFVLLQASWIYTSRVIPDVELIWCNNLWQQWFAWFLTTFKILCLIYIFPDTTERTVVVTYIQRLLSHQVLDIAKLRPYQGASNNTTTGSSSNLHQHYEIWLIVGWFSIANRVGWTKCFLVLRLLEHVFNSGQNGCWKTKWRSRDHCFAV